MTRHALHRIRQFLNFLMIDCGVSSLNTGLLCMFATAFVYLDTDDDGCAVILRLSASFRMYYYFLLPLLLREGS